MVPSLVPTEVEDDKHTETDTVPFGPMVGCNIDGLTKDARTNNADRQKKSKK